MVGTDEEFEDAAGFVLSATRDGIRHVRLNRPERLNAVSEEVYAGLEDALLDAAGDDRVRAILLTGEGRAFCAGADLKAHATRRRTAAEQRAYVWAGQRTCRLLQRLPQPVVAAVHGYAIGAGAEIALSADLLVCADDARMQFPEVGLGTFVGGAATQRLPLLVGPQRAKQLLLLGGRLTGTEAVDWGLAAQAVPAAELQDTAWSIARRLADQPALPSRLAKEALNRAGTMSADEALTFEAEALLACMRTDDWSSTVHGFDDAPDEHR